MDIPTKDEYEAEQYRKEREAVENPTSSVPEPIEGSKDSPIESTSSNIATEPPERSAYSHDDSTASKMAHDEDWKQDREHVVRKTSAFYEKRPKGTTEIPEPEPAKSTWRSNDPRTMGTPIDNPMVKEQKKESLFTKIAEAPRRLAEKGEEMGYAATKTYDKYRGKPAEAAAKEAYDSRMTENDIKFQKGEISSTIHKRRQMEYATAYDKEKKPTEQRMVDASIHVGNAFVAGLQHTQQKVAKEYRSSPAPKIKPSQGLVWSQVGNIGIPPVKTTTRKGKQVQTAAPKNRIDFGRSVSGSGGIDFSGGFKLFQKEEPKKKKR
jgi:hypothetical protein